MNTGGKSQRRVLEFQKYKPREEAHQRIMDEYYKSRGHKIKSREGTKGYDLIMLRGGQDDKVDKIEEKFRSDFYDDFLIEVIQDMDKPVPDLGWLYKTECDFLHYIICPQDTKPVFFYRINWREFRDWFIKKYLAGKLSPNAKISTKGYGTTLNIAVPIRAIPPALVTRFEIATPAASTQPA